MLAFKVFHCFFVCFFFNLKQSTRWMKIAAQSCTFSTDVNAEKEKRKKKIRSEPVQFIPTFGVNKFSGSSDLDEVTAGP